MWSVCGRIVVVQDPIAISPFFRSFSENWFTQSSQDLQVEFLVNCFSIGSVLVVYDTLRIKKRQFLDVDSRPERRSLSTEVLPSLNWWNQSDTCVWPIVSSPNACCNNWYVSVAVFPILKLVANALFSTVTHRQNRYDINTHVTSATYYSQLSKHSHLQLVSWVAKTCTNMSRLVANTSHPVNNHYNSNPDTSWTNLVYVLSDCAWWY